MTAETRYVRARYCRLSNESLFVYLLLLLNLRIICLVTQPKNSSVSPFGISAKSKTRTASYTEFVLQRSYSDSRLLLCGYALTELRHYLDV